MHTPSAIAFHWAATLRSFLWMYRNNDHAVFRQLLRDHLDARSRLREAASAYRVLDASSLLARKTSRRAFLFGSGWSLNELSDEEWKRFAQDDTVGFSGSFYLRKIPLTFLLLRAWTETTAGSLAWKKDAEEVVSEIEANPFLSDTVFVFPQGLNAIFTNRLLGYRMWNRDKEIFFYLADKVSRQPHRDIRRGLVHRMGTLCSAISLAVAMGYEEIVLVGVDLYDNRYFWLPADKTLGWSETEQKLVPADQTVRGIHTTSPHNTVNNGIVDHLGDWSQHLRSRFGVQLFVYNPRSLLTKTVPLFAWD